jgi:hypothetical protein
MCGGCRGIDNFKEINHNKDEDNCKKLFRVEHGIHVCIHPNIRGRIQVARNF